MERISGDLVPAPVVTYSVAIDRDPSAMHACRYPELTAASLQHLQTQGCSDGYSTSRTCEMSLSNHSGIHFRGLVYLVDQATSAKAAKP